MPAATPIPSQRPVWPIEDPQPADDPQLIQDPEPPAEWLDDPWPTDDLVPEDPERIAAWLEELERTVPWLDEDPDGDDRGPAGPPEVFKAGFWDRTKGDGGGFAGGGAADHLPPGPVLAGLADDRWQAGLGHLSDDELIGVLRAARRLASWAAAMELAAVTDLWARRIAEEDAGDTGAAEHADDEIAAALTLTRHAAEQALNLAVALRRLPATRAALAAGDIDLPRAKVIADELTGLDDPHAAAVEAAIIGAAARQTTGQLRAATRQAVQAADPDAARKRKEEALREARVERWTESAGTSALAGRDLPPVQVLAADANLTALAQQLKAAGGEGTLDNLRAKIYLALLTGIPAASLLPASAGSPAVPGDSPAGPSSATTGTSVARDYAASGSSATGAPAATGTPAAGDSPASVVGRINLTVPLATWLDRSDAPGQVAGYGPLDATDSRTLASALATQLGTKWCLTVTGPDGRPVAHGCARAGPSGGGAPRTGDRPRAGPGAGPRARPQVVRSGRTGMDSHNRPGAEARARQWTIALTPLDGGGCDHAWETPAYRPSDAARHLVNIRHASCVFPGCRRPAAQCDADHTLAYECGGKTCLCNLAPLCRHHHQVKQTPGWALDQATPGTLTWTTPSGRRYTTTPTSYRE